MYSVSRSDTFRVWDFTKTRLGTGISVSVVVFIFVRVGLCSFIRGHFGLFASYPQGSIFLAQSVIRLMGRNLKG